MRKSRFTEAQIIGMLKEQEAGLPTSELCRKHGLAYLICTTHMHKWAAQIHDGSDACVKSRGCGGAARED